MATMVSRRNWRQRMVEKRFGPKNGLVLLIVSMVAAAAFLLREDPVLVDSTPRASKQDNDNNKELFDSLLAKHPFSTEFNHKELFEKIHKDHANILGFTHGGRDIVDALIADMAKEKEVVVVMEVGVWFGDSVIRWLNASPSARVVAVDPFVVPRKDDPMLGQMANEDKQHFEDPAFHRALAEYTISKRVPDASKRTLIVRGSHPQDSEFLFQAHRAGTGPHVDIFYLDGGKSANVETHTRWLNTIIGQMLQEFPNVVICGDDWAHGHAYPFQSAILDIAKAHGRIVFVKSNKTWLMVKENEYKISAQKVTSPTAKAPTAE